MLRINILFVYKILNSSKIHFMYFILCKNRINITFHAIAAHIKSLLYQRLYTPHGINQYTKLRIMQNIKLYKHTIYSLFCRRRADPIRPPLDVRRSADTMPAADPGRMSGPLENSRPGPPLIRSAGIVYFFHTIKLFFISCFSVNKNSC